jgi:MYXO-CTERM domain-containing protein
MIGPLLRVAAQATAARSLRLAAHEATMRVLFALGAAIAVAVGAVCFTAAAFIVLERQLDSASAWAILGAVWGLAGLFYFAAARRRRG